VTCINPKSCGSRGGLQIIQVHFPFRVAKIHVSRGSNGYWTLTTENVRRFGLVQWSEMENPATLTIDSSQFKNSDVSKAYLPNHFFCTQQYNCQWELITDGSWILTERNPNTYGPFEQIFLNKIHIVYGTSGPSTTSQAYLAAASFITHNWYYQGRGVSFIFSDTEYQSGLLTLEKEAANVILLGDITTNTLTKLWASNLSVAVQWDTTGKTSTFALGPRSFTQPSQGIVYLAPHPYGSDSRLVGVVAGTDLNGFYKAISLLPYKSAMLLPDFAVVGPQVGWKGEGGFLAAGYWDNTWQYTSSNAFLK